MNNYIEHQNNYKVRYEKYTYGVVCDSNLLRREFRKLIVVMQIHLTAFDSKQISIN